MNKTIKMIFANLLLLQFSIQPVFAIREIEDAHHFQDKEAAACAAALANKTAAFDNARTSFQKILKFEKQTSTILLEREKLISEMLSTIVLGGNMLVLGLPGTAKSKLKSVVLMNILDENGQPSVFSRTMDRDTQRSELLGPLDPKELQENGKYVRMVDQSMLNRKFVVFDEFFRARPGAFSYLLEGLSDRTLSDGTSFFKGELEAGFAFSNGTLHDVYTIFEVDPTLGGADAPKAIFDRFLHTYYVTPLADDDNQMKADLGLLPSVDTIDKLSIHEIYNVRKALEYVEFPTSVYKAFVQLTDTVAQKNHEFELNSLKEAEQSRKPHRGRATKLLIDRMRGAGARYLRYIALKRWAKSNGQTPATVTIHDLRSLADVYGLDGASNEILEHFQMTFGNRSPSDTIQIKTVKAERANVINNVESLENRIKDLVTTELNPDHFEGVAVARFNEYRTGKAPQSDLIYELGVLKNESQRPATMSGSLSLSFLDSLEKKVKEAIIRKINTIARTQQTPTLRTTQEEIDAGLLLEELKDLYTKILMLRVLDRDIVKIQKLVEDFFKTNTQQVLNQIETERLAQEREAEAASVAELNARREAQRAELLKSSILDSHGQFLNATLFKKQFSFNLSKIKTNVPSFTVDSENNAILFTLYDKEKGNNARLASINKANLDAVPATHSSQNFIAAGDVELRKIFLDNGSERAPPMIPLGGRRASLGSSLMLAIYKNIGIIFDYANAQNNIIHKFLLSDAADFLSSYDQNKKELTVLDRRKGVLRVFNLGFQPDGSVDTDNFKTVELASATTNYHIREILEDVTPQIDIHNNNLNAWGSYRDNAIKRSFFAVDPTTQKAWFSRSGPSDIWEIDLKNGVMFQALQLPTQSVPVGYDETSKTAFFMQFNKKDGSDVFASAGSKYVIVDLNNITKQTGFKEFSLNTPKPVYAHFAHHWIVPNRFLVMNRLEAKSNNQRFTYPLIYDVVNNRVIESNDASVLAKCISGKRFEHDIYACFNQEGSEILFYKLNLNIP